MTTKFGFTLMTVSEFKTWIAQQNVARTILFIQQHHTFAPNYRHFKGNNHFELQRGMKNHHVHNNGWSDIGQHFTIYPDGMIATGRSLERSPACIFGNNNHSICIENIGFFDTGEDQMLPEQQDAIVQVTAALCESFRVPVSTDRIVYHHWFDLGSGARTNGSGSTKSCPGTNFFGGNKVTHCQQNFLPLVSAALNDTIVTAIPPALIEYGSVTANTLNIRIAPDASSSRIGQTSLGAIIRIYKKNGNWFKISQSKEEWVFGNFVKPVQRATVNANVLNVRSGPSTRFNRVGAVVENQEVFIYEQEGNWSQISLDEQWVSTKFLDLSN